MNDGTFTKYGRSSRGRGVLSEDPAGNLEPCIGKI